MKFLIVIGGVSGSGKSTIAAEITDYLKHKFPQESIQMQDADDFHPIANKQKMSNGIPLTDEDRIGWLESMKNYSEQYLQNHNVLVWACSALKCKYRQQFQSLSATFDIRIKFIILLGPYSLIENRMRHRAHFMKSNMLYSQFQTLELPFPISSILTEEQRNQISEKDEQIWNQVSIHKEEITEYHHDISVHISMSDSDTIPKVSQQIIEQYILPMFRK